MNMTPGEKKRFVILSKPFYFGWLLGFPFYGPAFYKLAPFHSYKGIGLITIFMIFHLLTYLLAAIFLKNIYRWHNLMLGSALITFLANIMLFLPFDFVWPLVMAITGSAASIYVLGWSVVYSLSGLVKGRVGIMALVIIGGNLVLLALSIIGDLFSGAFLLIASLFSLLIAIIILLRTSGQLKEQIITNNSRPSLPKKTVLFFALFAFIIYINGGFTYNIMMPHFVEVDSLLASYLPYLVYILALAVVYRYRNSINRTYLVYCGVSFIGLAFIVFANLSNSIIGYLLTVTLMETAFALIDLFVWISLNSLTYVFGTPYPIFGFVLAANILSILVGDIISTVNLDLSSDIFSLIAMLSSTSVLLVILVIPRLLRSIYGALESVVENKDKLGEKANEDFNILLHNLDPDNRLTQREKEIFELALLGLTNKKIGELLFISENTTKTHLGKIYSKLGVSGKKELINIAVTIKD